VTVIVPEMKTLPCSSVKHSTDTAVTVAAKAGRTRSNASALAATALSTDCRTLFMTPPGKIKERWPIGHAARAFGNEVHDPPKNPRQVPRYP
jgi:hypothetical protein